MHGAGGGQKGPRARMNDPWTWTTVWGWTVRAGGGLGRQGHRGENWDNCDRINKQKKEVSTCFFLN